VQKIIVSGQGSMSKGSMRYTTEERTPLGSHPTILNPKAFNNFPKDDKIDSEEWSGCDNGTGYPLVTRSARYSEEK